MNALSQSFPPGLLQKHSTCPMQSSQQPRKCKKDLVDENGVLSRSKVLMFLQILLVPTTECLLTGKDRETDSSFADLAISEDFLASHVLRLLPGNISPEGNSVRDNRGKAKQFNTVNGRTIVVKESFVYSNKGTASSSAWKDLPRLTLLQASEISIKRNFSATNCTTLTALTRCNGSYTTSRDLL